MELFDLALLILATYRLTSIVHRERIAEPLRKLVGFDGLGYPATFLGYLFSCFWCLSVWCSLLIIILYITMPSVVLILAVSAGSMLCKEIESEE